MEDFGHIPARLPPDLGERASSARLRRSRAHPRPPRGCWAGTPSEGSEAVPARWPPRRRQSPDSPRESRSLSDVALRPPDGARKPRRRSWRPRDAWGEPRSQPQARGSEHSPAWPLQCQLLPPRQGVSPPPYPEGAYSPLSGMFGTEEAQSGDPWAVPVRGGLDRWSLSSFPSENSWAPSQELGTLSAGAYAPKRDGGDRLASLGSPCVQPALAGKEANSRHTQILKNKLEEAMVSSRDQKIVALVLTRLQKAQRMRELQQQAAAAWEDLKRSDHKVQVTLERERKLLLQQNRAQWQREKEQRKTRPGRGEPRAPRGRDAQTQRADNLWTAPPLEAEDPGARRQERPERARPEPAKPRRPRLRELERELERERERERALELERALEQTPSEPRKQTGPEPPPPPPPPPPMGRPEPASPPTKQPPAADARKQVREANLSSLVNFQARKVLMDCQVKAEELLRRLSLEQSSPRAPEPPPNGLAKERPREPRERAPPEDEQGQQARLRAQELDAQRRARKRLLVRLGEQKIQQARSSAHRSLSDRAQHARELTLLRESHHRVLKLKAEKEEKCHVEGIKEALRKKEQRAEQLAQEKEAAATARACRRDSGGGPCYDHHQHHHHHHHHVDTASAGEAQVRGGY